MSNLYLYNNTVTNVTGSSSTMSNLSVTNNTISNLSIANTTTISTLSTTAMTATSLSLSGFLNTSQPFIIVFAGTAQTIANTTDTYLTTYWSGAVTSSGISQTTSTSGIFSVTYAGTYLVVVNIGFDNNSTGARVMWVEKNSVAVRYNMLDIVGHDVTSADISVLVQLNAGDNIRTRVFQNSGGSLNVDPLRGARLSMVKLF